MADGAERREARRFTMSLPMRVLPREDTGREVDANTRDVSYRGLYFSLMPISKLAARLNSSSFSRSK